MSKARIFIVEDNQIVAIEIKVTLTKLGFDVVKIASSYDEAFNSILELEPDIVMMDIDLDASKSGIDLARDINKVKKIPILYLTAFSDDDTMSKAFDTDPVGYIVKPFKREELKSSVMLALYKISQTESKYVNNEYYNLGSGYYFDLKTKTLYYETEMIKLGAKEKLLLLSLVQAKGEYVSKDELEYRLWVNNPPSSSSLRTLVYRLKVKVGYEIIESSYYSGYKLVTI